MVESQRDLIVSEAMKEMLLSPSQSMRSFLSPARGLRRLGLAGPGTHGNGGDDQKECQKSIQVAALCAHRELPRWDVHAFGIPPGPQRFPSA